MTKAAKPFVPVVATANDLRSGQVVFRAATGDWTPAIAAAEVAGDPAAADALLSLARADQDSCVVVEPALIAIVREGAFVRPATLKELIRATGPTVPVPAG